MRKYLLLFSVGICCINVAAAMEETHIKYIEIQPFNKNQLEVERHDIGDLALTLALPNQQRPAIVDLRYPTKIELNIPIDKTNPSERIENKYIRKLAWFFGLSMHRKDENLVMYNTSSCNQIDAVLWWSKELNNKSFNELDYVNYMHLQTSYMFEDDNLNRIWDESVRQALLNADINLNLLSYRDTLPLELRYIDQTFYHSIEKKDITQRYLRLVPVSQHSN